MGPNDTSLFYVGFRYAGPTNMRDIKSNIARCTRWYKTRAKAPPPHQLKCSGEAARSRIFLYLTPQTDYVRAPSDRKVLAAVQPETARAIHKLWDRSLENFLEIGRHLAAAKAEIGHGGFGDWVAVNLPFGIRTAQMLMKIAADERLAGISGEAKHASFLPREYSTLSHILKRDTLAITAKSMARVYQNRGNRRWGGEAIRARIFSRRYQFIVPKRSTPSVQFFSMSGVSPCNLTHPGHRQSLDEQGRVHGVHGVRVVSLICARAHAHLRFHMDSMDSMDKPIVSKRYGCPGC